MTSEEIIDQQIWDVLQDIKVQYLATVGKQVKYRIPKIEGMGIVPKYRRIDILYKLQEKGAFIIRYNDQGARLGDGDTFYLVIKEPEFVNIYKSYEQKNLKRSVGSISKLFYHPIDGVTEYRGEIKKFKSKSKAFLTFLNSNKNVPFDIEAIKKNCNPLIKNQKYYFKGHKDTWDTVNSIRKGLKVEKGEFFPIEESDVGWIWIEK